MEPDVPFVAHDVEQGTDEWLALRAGYITASGAGSFISPAKLQFSRSETMRRYMAQLLWERGNKRPMPTHQTWAMQRGSLNGAAFYLLYWTTSIGCAKSSLVCYIVSQIARFNGGGKICCQG